MTLERLKRFRQDVYGLLRKAADATMDLMDAVLTTKSILFENNSLLLNYAYHHCLKENGRHYMKR